MSNDLPKEFDLLPSGKRLPTLLEWHATEKLDRAALRRLLTEYWCVLDAPLLAASPEQLVALFRDAGFLSDTRKITAPPSEGLTVYRGCHPAVRRGLAWTTSRERAEFFIQYAQQHRARAYYTRAIRRPEAVGESRLRPQLYTAHAPAPVILAMFNERQEYEVVVDPAGLVDVRESTEGEARQSNASTLK